MTTPTLTLTPTVVAEIAAMATTDPPAFSILLEQFAEREQLLILDALLEAPARANAPADRVAVQT